MVEDLGRIYRRMAIAEGAFSPSAPINRVTLFAGRSSQIVRAIGVVYQRGQHGIIFGERGVGKTSLANLIGDFVAGLDDGNKPEMPRFLTPRVNCTGNSTYESIWRDVFSKITLFGASNEGLRIGNYSETLKAKLVPEMVQNLLDVISTQKELIVIIDEFDRLKHAGSRRLMADTIKSLSDHSVGATIFMVGVGDTVGELIAEHQSVARALVQIPLQRMESTELQDIIDKGITRFNSRCQDFQLDMQPEGSNLIVAVSRGLPHYTHLLAQHACCVAIEKEQSKIDRSIVADGMARALNGVQQSTLSSYDKAVTSAHRNALYCEVLAACALAVPDRQGYFAAADVVSPLGKIRKRPVEIANFMDHLQAFCKPERGTVLEKTGEPRRFRFRFADPLMQPYVVLRALTEKKIDLGLLLEYSANL